MSHNFISKINQFSCYGGKFTPFYPILVIKHYFIALFIAYMHSTLQTLSNDVPYMHIKERRKTLNMGGRGKIPPPSKRGDVSDLSSAVGQLLFPTT